MNTIAKRRAEIDAIIHEMQARLVRLQEECAHAQATKTAKSDTGNWDRSADRYWYACKCPDCGLWWNIPQ